MLAVSCHKRPFLGSLHLLSELRDDFYSVAKPRLTPIPLLHGITPPSDAYHCVETPELCIYNCVCKSLASWVPGSWRPHLILLVPTFLTCTDV